MNKVLYCQSPYIPYAWSHTIDNFGCFFGTWTSSESHLHNSITYFRSAYFLNYWRFIRSPAQEISQLSAAALAAAVAVLAGTVVEDKCELEPKLQPPSWPLLGWTRFILVLIDLKLKVTKIQSIFSIFPFGIGRYCCGGKVWIGAKITASYFTFVRVNKFYFSKGDSDWLRFKESTS